MLGDFTPSVSPRVSEHTRRPKAKGPAKRRHHQPQPLVLILGSKAQILPEYLRVAAGVVR